MPERHIPLRGLATRDEGNDIQFDTNTINFVGAGVDSYSDEFGKITVVVTGGGATGEANTASNAGLTGYGLVLNKFGVDLPFKSLSPGSGISITDDVANKSLAISLGSHGHAISDITNLQTNLDNKLNASVVSAFGLTLIDDTDESTARTTLGLGSAATSAASAFATASHTHTAAQITDFNTAADARITTQKGVASGLASLDGSGKVPTSQLPALAITSVFTVSSQAAQLALAAEEGDVAVRTDLSKSYVKNSGTAGTMADWTELLTPTDAVLSVNGQTGAVTLSTTNISEGTNLYYTDTRARGAFSGSGGVNYNNTTGAITLTYGTTSGTACQGNDSRLSDSRTPSGSAGGDLTGTYPNPVIGPSAVTYAKMQNVSASSRLLGRKTAGAGVTEECSLSEVLDMVGSAARGDILYRDAASWTRLGAGTSGQFLQTQGTGANPQWATASGGGGSPGGSNTHIQFNNAGAFGGSANMTWDGTRLQLGQASSVTGAIRLGSSTSGAVTIQPMATTGTWTLFLGNATGSNSLAIGESSTCSSSVQSVAVGFSANATNNSSVAVGAYCFAQGLESVAIGYAAQATASRSAAYGRGAAATHTDSYVLGYNATSTIKNELTFSGFNGGSSLGTTDAVGFHLIGTSSSAANRDMALLRSYWATATDASRASRLEIGTFSTTTFQLGLNIQNTQVTVNGTTPNASAQLQVDSTTRGFLPPRMTTTQRDAISSPAAGLMIFNSSTSKINYYDGTTWVAL